MPANTTEIEKRLWDVADDLRANSKLKSSEYSVPVLGLDLPALRRLQVQPRRAGIIGQKDGPPLDRQDRLSGARRVVSAGEGPLRAVAATTRKRRHRQSNR